jgi:hypothetical protein
MPKGIKHLAKYFRQENTILAQYFTQKNTMQNLLILATVTKYKRKMLNSTTSL